MPKQVTTVRLTDHAKRLLTKLAKRLGLTKSGVMELSIREKADKEGIQ